MKTSLIIFGLTIGLYVANAEIIKVATAAPDGSFTVAQTNGQDRRSDRQDCRQEGGLVGADKRNCKQDSRGNDDDTSKSTNENGDATKQ